MLLCTLPAYEKNFVLPLIRNNEVPFFIFDPGISWQAQILKQMADIYVHRKSKTAPLRILSSFSLIWPPGPKTIPIQILPPSGT